MARARRKRKAKGAGEYGKNRVRIIRHHRTGELTLDWRERCPDGITRRKRRTLPGATMADAERAAEVLAVELRQRDGRAETVLTVASLFDKYLAEKTPQKGASSQALDKAAARLFVAMWGGRPVESLDDGDFETYVDRRRSGTLRLPNGAVGVRNQQIHHELKVLRSACRWAMRRKSPGGAWLLARNPLDGYTLPKESNPCRPVMNPKDYARLRAVAWDISPEFGAALELCDVTGHRLSQVGDLRWSDVDFDVGKITWRGDPRAEKKRWQHTTPLMPEAVAVLTRLRRERPMIGCDLIFPAPMNREVPRDRSHFYHWWERAEKRSGVARVRGRRFHSLRRAFGTDLLHEPLKVAQQLGGWKSPRVLLECYQHPDDTEQRKALENRASRRRAG